MSDLTIAELLEVNGTRIMVGAVEAALEREKALGVRIAELEAENERLKAKEQDRRRAECAHCDERPGGAEGTIWCAECLEWWRRACEPMEELLAAKREWSERTFGPGQRTASTTAHIRKELLEIEAAPEDTTEWIDVALLAIDGYWRAGGSDLLAALWEKHRINTAREWHVGADGPVEHVR